MTTLAIETSLLMLILWMILCFSVLKAKSKTVLYVVMIFQFLLSLYMLNDGYYPFYPALFMTFSVVIAMVGVLRAFEGYGRSGLKNMHKYRR